MPIRTALCKDIVAAITTAIVLTAMPQNAFLSETAVQDTMPPSFRWLSPRDYSIFTTNTLRLSIDASDNEGGSGIDKVMFYTQYFDTDDRTVPRVFIGEVTSHPYEILWDCSGIPDQNLEKLRLYCEVYDKAGNVATYPTGYSNRQYPLVVLDRNPNLNNQTIFSRYTRHPIVIDGVLSEWAASDSIQFKNNDNLITVYTLWNKKNLYFGIRVAGRSVISHFPPGSESIVGMALEDLVEIFLDTDHDHYEIFRYPDRHFFIAAAGLVCERRITLNDSLSSDLILDPNIDVSVEINGTLNDDSDEDIDYTIEFAVTWEELGFKPESGASMGLEIWNIDKDFIDGNYFYAGWSTNASNLSNPSEWGNIVLTGGENLLFESVLAFMAIGGGTVAFAVHRRKLSRNRKRMLDEANEMPDIEENEYIKKARAYVAEHYEEETLSREDVAPVVGLTPSYFGKLFKQNTGTSFADYLTDVRIEKSKYLLTSTQKNISEIALQIGFSSQSYFAYQFKKRNGISPTEYRQETRKSPSSRII